MPLAFDLEAEPEGEEAAEGGTQRLPREERDGHEGPPGARRAAALPPVRRRGNGRQVAERGGAGGGGARGVAGYRTA